MSQNNLELIPIYKSSLPRPEKWLDYLEIAYRNSKFSNFGEISHLLERRVADFLGVKEANVVTCVNATQAIAGAISTAEKNSLDWTIPSWTFTATPAAIISANKEFYFSDVDENWRISIQDSNVNVVDVLPFGVGIDIQRLESLCTGELVVDGAASFDALRYSNICHIQRRFALVISFHPTKFPAGPEGAVFISNDLEWCKRFRYWTIFGMDEVRESYFPGTNAKLNEFSAAVTLSSLDSYEIDREKYVELGKKVTSISNERNFEVYSPMSQNYATPYWILKGDKTRIKKVEEVFGENNISARKWWNRGCHNMAAYAKFRKLDLTNTEIAHEISIGLPFFQSLSDLELKRISYALSLC